MKRYKHSILKKMPARRIQYQFKACTSYKHQKGWKDITDSKGRIERNPVEIAGPLSPGVCVRHNAFSTPTKLYDLPAQIAAPLYFAVVGCLPLAINRGSGVLLIPDVTDLIAFPAIRAAMTPKTDRECQITIASDAALQTQLRLRATEEINKWELPACPSVLTFQPTPWASQQKSRRCHHHGGARQRRSTKPVQRCDERTESSDCHT